jgi:predicted secreted protein
MRYTFQSIVCLFLLCVSLAHGAEVMTQFDTDASIEVDNDEMLVVLSVSKDGPNATQISQEVLAKLSGAVERSKLHADIERKTGQISTTPVWGPNGKTKQWSAQAQLQLVSTNLSALSLLASELTDVMQITHVSFNLSAQQRAATEKKLLSTLAVNFQRKAHDLTDAFGFSRHEIKSLNFSQQNQNIPVMRMAMATPRAMADGAGPVPIPHEGGKTTISLHMSAQISLWP